MPYESALHANDEWVSIYVLIASRLMDGGMIEMDSTM
jgi:hypothetical protein